MMRNKALVFIPTYNERENVTLLYQEIKQLPQSPDILFLDDNSPDGTGIIIDNLVKQDSKVSVIHRPKKLGLGTAHQEAFRFAHKNKYDYLVTMDADFTHHPSYIPHLLEQVTQADISIGSRYVSGGKMKGWGTIRLPFTYFWRTMIKQGLGLPYDCTTAFRSYRVQALKPHLYESLQSKGFAFCMESLYTMHRNGLIITEIPIQAHNRKHGKSKLSVKIMHEVLKTYLRLVWNRVKS